MEGDQPTSAVFQRPDVMARSDLEQFALTHIPRDMCGFMMRFKMARRETLLYAYVPPLCHMTSAVPLSKDT